jgi:hypothetical protein
LIPDAASPTEGVLPLPSEGGGGGEARLVALDVYERGCAVRREWTPASGEEGPPPHPLHISDDAGTEYRPAITQIGGNVAMRCFGV